jgi:phosphatidylglycerol---prolipoprotein diacylglyceryl transferase
VLSYPDIDPVALSLGPVQVHWYGVMYLLGFAVAWWLGKRRAVEPSSPLRPEQISDLIFYGALGVVLGGRAGYVLFYHFNYFLQDPLWLFKVWDGGMSFHGGLIGVTGALYLYARKLKIGFFPMMDFVAPLVPIGLGAGRLGNFIGAELWGRVSDVPWAMVFPGAGVLPRHPSQLYQFMLEGVLLFVILWCYSSISAAGRPRPTMTVSALFLIFYGLFRFVVEFFRQPDAHLNFVALDWLTMGQLLSLPMIFGGLALFVFGHRRAAASNKTTTGLC